MRLNQLKRNNSGVGKNPVTKVITEARKISKGKRAYTIKKLSIGYAGIGLINEGLSYFDKENSSRVTFNIHRKRNFLKSTFLRREKVRCCIIMEQRTQIRSEDTTVLGLGF